MIKFNQAKEVVAGYGNLLKKKLNIADNEIETIAQLRANVCNTCASHSATTNSCKTCGCYVPAKVRSLLSSCPEGHWNLIL